MQSGNSFHVGFSNCAWVVDDLLDQFQRLIDQTLELFFHQIISLGLAGNQFIKLVLLELNLSLALDHDHKRIRCVVKELFVNFWLEEVHLLEVIVIELDHITKLFLNDSADDVVQSLRNVWLLACVERFNVNDFLFVLVKNFWQVVVRNV